MTITFPHVTDIHSYLKLLYFKVGFFFRIILKLLCIPTMIAVIVFGQGSMSVLLHSGSKRDNIYIYFSWYPCKLYPIRMESSKKRRSFLLVNGKQQDPVCYYVVTFVTLRREEGGRSIMSPGLHHKRSAFYPNVLCWSDIFTSCFMSHVGRNTEFQHSIADN